MLFDISVLWCEFDYFVLVLLGVKNESIV